MLQTSLPLSLVSSDSRKEIIMPDSVLNCLSEHHRTQSDSNTFRCKLRIESFLQQELCPSIPKTELTRDGAPIQLKQIERQPLLGQKERREALVKPTLCWIDKNSFTAFGVPSFSMQ